MNDQNHLDKLNCIIAETGYKIVFNPVDVNDGDYLMRVVHTGHLDLEEWKKSTRPTPIGNELVTLHGVSTGVHEMQSETEAESSTQVRGSSRGRVSTDSASNGAGSGTNEIAGEVLTPSFNPFGFNSDNATFVPVQLSQSVGVSDSRSAFKQASSSLGISEADLESEAFGFSRSQAIARGTSVAESESDAYVTRYADLPIGQYTLAEQIHRAVGAALRMAPRECLVKVHHHPPVRTRALDVPANFKTIFGKRLIMTALRDAIIARSPYLIPITQADALIKGRSIPADQPPVAEHGSATTERVPPIVRDADSYAEGFWQRLRSKGARPPRGKKPTLIIDNDDGDKTQ